MEQKPILYSCAFSRGLRCSWAAEEAGVPIALELLPFPPRHKAPGFLELNPLGTVPLLVHGNTRMTESCAIAHYLAVLGAERDPRARELIVEPGEADYGEYLDFTYHADATLTFPQTVYMRFALFEKDKGWEAAGEAYATWFWKRLVKLEARLETRDYLCANRFTIADICCGYALILAERVGLDEGVPASLKSYRERLTGRAGFRRAAAREAQGAGSV